MPGPKPKLRDIDGEEAKSGECVYCGHEKEIYAPNYQDPYTTELEPEADDHITGDWCLICWENRKDSV